MREYVLALKAIWAAWQEQGRLDFAGDFYTHTLMTPFFAPEPHPFGPPPVFLAGVGPRMTEVAGEVCDGFFFHPFTTERYMDEVTLPALRRGTGQGRARRSRRIRPRRSGLHLRRPRRGRAGDGDRGDEAADRLLRLDPDVPAGARSARLG